MLEMLEQSGILTAPGSGIVFLIVVLLCFLIVRKVKDNRKINKETDMLPAAVPVPIQTGEVKATAAVTAAIVAAVTEYRKYNS